MECSVCGRRISRGRKFIVITLAQRNRLGYAPVGDEAVLCIRDAMTDCEFTKLTDLDSAKVGAHVTRLKQVKDLHARAINARLTAIKSLTRWLFRTERIRTDPMMQVAKLNVKTDRCFERRALTDDEIAWLLATTKIRRARLRMPGADRAMVYRLAIETGLRVSELASLTPASFSLADANNASLKVAVAYSKHRRDDVVPLRREMAEAMIAFLRNKPSNTTVFPLSTRTAEMIRSDMLGARKAWLKASRTRTERKRREQTDFLTARNGLGHILDFHALRHTFITRLARSGTTPAVAMALARHCTITLTMDHYTHVLDEDRRLALDRLPSTAPPEKSRRRTRMDDGKATNPE